MSDIPDLTIVPNQVSRKCIQLINNNSKICILVKFQLIFFTYMAVLCSNNIGKGGGGGEVSSHLKRVPYVPLIDG